MEKSKSIFLDASLARTLEATKLFLQTLMAAENSAVSAEVDQEGADGELDAAAVMQPLELTLAGAHAILAVILTRAGKMIRQGPAAAGNVFGADALLKLFAASGGSQGLVLEQRLDVTGEKDLVGGKVPFVDDVARRLDRRAQAREFQEAVVSFHGIDHTAALLPEAEPPR